MGTKIRKISDEVVTFDCPGCKEPHSILIVPHKGMAAWTFNGDLAKPTFSPSINSMSGHYAYGDTSDCWCIYNAEHPNDKNPIFCTICHSFVVDGNIQFLDDCTHALKGQTVELPDLKDTQHVE